MGLSIDKEEFSEREQRDFTEKLSENLEALRVVLERPGFGVGPRSIGAEVELNLVDDAQRPLPENLAVLDGLAEPHHVQLEIDRFNLEINAPHGLLAGRPLTRLREDLDHELAVIGEAAAKRGGRVAMIGILPTLEIDDLGRHALSDRVRYRALDRALGSKADRSFPIRIDGEEPLTFEASDIATEGANTSFQVHLRVDPSEFAAHYNAAQIATGVVLALAGNSPTFLGRSLWAETRIALFRQSVDDRPHPLEGDWRPARVSFGHGWVRRGAMELFDECVAMHEPLLPVIGTEDALGIARAGGLPALSELRLHNGTVWRWNRAIYDPQDGGHVRIEMRALPAGPTSADMVANAALLLGLTLALAPRIESFLARMTFGHARQNFYQAARLGLDASLLWPSAAGLSPVPRGVEELASALLPEASAALSAAGVDAGEAESHLAIIERRLRSGTTGAVWQRRALAELEKRSTRRAALAEMLRRYVALSAEGEPVHAWPLPSVE